MDPHEAVSVFGLFSDSRTSELNEAIYAAWYRGESSGTPEHLAGKARVVSQYDDETGLLEVAARCPKLGPIVDAFHGFIVWDVVRRPEACDSVELEPRGNYGRG